MYLSVGVSLLLNDPSNERIALANKLLAHFVKGHIDEAFVPILSVF